MTLSQTPFEKFDTDCQSSNLKSALESLADYLIEKSRFHELFEVRKLLLRQQLGLPIEKWQAIDELPDETAEKLEKGLLDVCLEVGTRFMKIGDVASGWQYLEPVGDRPMVAKMLREIEVTDENVEALIQVAVGNGIEAELGFGLVLERYGTCSSITTYESQLSMQPLNIRRGPARMLVNHLYDELCHRVMKAIEEKENKKPESTRLIDLIDGRDWLFEGLGHHIDTTHLASTVKISKILDDSDAILQAIEMSEYGSRLHEDFQYPGQVPFDRLYIDTLQWLKAVRDEDSVHTDLAVNRVKQVAHENSNKGNLDGAAWFVYLLDKLQRGQAATEAYLELIHVQQSESMISEDVCPNLTYLVSRYGCFEIAKSALLQQGDLLGYATVASIEMQRVGE